MSGREEETAAELGDAVTPFRCDVEWYREWKRVAEGIAGACDAQSAQQ